MTEWSGDDPYNRHYKVGDMRTGKKREIHVCMICRRRLDNQGYGKIQHYRAHVRRNEAVELTDKDGNPVFDKVVD